MLKIVDYYPNTNKPFPLEELEKFGFKFNKTYREYQIFSPGRYEKICVTDDRRILIEDFSGFSMVEYLDIIFDLIKADLVEKEKKDVDTKML